MWRLYSRSVAQIFHRQAPGTHQFVGSIPAANLLKPYGWCGRPDLICIMCGNKETRQLKLNNYCIIPNKKNISMQEMYM